MGGGDLNLKKSWHPSTLRNIERVWKAEQKHEVEQQKIEQLQKELAEERAREEIQTFAEDQGVVRKKDERLDWMYQGPAAMVNRDEYLLGRKIDKTLETLQQIEKGGEPEKEEGVGIASNSMFSSQNLSGNTTVDLAAKIREDPLFSIMKKEKEERKNLLTNPVKMKQLQDMLKASLNKSKSKKNKKNKKKKHQDSDSDEEETYKKQKKHQDSGEEKQYKKQKKHKTSYSSESEEEYANSTPFRKNHQLKQVKEFNRNYDSFDGRSTKYEYEDNSYKRNSKSPYFSNRDNNQHSSCHKASHPNYEHRESKHESYEERTYTKAYQSSRNRSSKYEFDEGNSKNGRHKSSHISSNDKESDYYSSNLNNQSSSQEYSDSKPRLPNRSEQRSLRIDERKPSKAKSYAHQENNKKEGDKKRKVDVSERDRLLKEMQENAKWREEQRKRNTQRYKEEEEKERKNTVEKVDSDAFLKPILSKAAGKGSLEDRLKQKIFTIQRSSSAMDKNFARRD